VRVVDLSHTFGPGYGAYPGLPQPVVRDHLGFDESHPHYAPGTEFNIKIMEIVANTGTYVDTPAHRYRDGHDLAGLALDRVAAVPGVVVTTAATAIDLMHSDTLAAKAVLFHTGWSRNWGTPEYGRGGHPHLTAAAATALVTSGVAVVGIDSFNIDDTADGGRPAHSILLAAGIPIVEHLVGLEVLPEAGFRFYAVPPKFAGVGTFPVRAFAVIES
jgi:kynurenine formamidase